MTGRTEKRGGRQQHASTRTKATEDAYKDLVIDVRSFGRILSCFR